MSIEINYFEELEPYLEQFDNHKIRGDKLQSCSPFRMDRKPSFAVNLENGTFIDSGSTDDKLYKGNFITLLAFLRDEEYEDTMSYIKEKYARMYDNVEQLSLSYELVEPVEFTDLQETSYSFSSYLDYRNIPEEIQQEFGTFQKEDIIGMPIYDVKGTLVNIKYRKTNSKAFWYEEESYIKQHLFGFDKVVAGDFDYCYLVEGEIDAMTLWSLGYPAVATFGASISNQQISLLKKLKKVIILPDNDEVGLKFKDKVINQLIPFISVGLCMLPEKYKDANDIFPRLLPTFLDEVKEVKISFDLSF